MKATVTKFTLTYARQAHRRAKEIQQLFRSDASEFQDGKFVMPIGKYKKLSRKYATRERQCTRRYRRKSKSIRRLMTTTDNWQ